MAPVTVGITAHFLRNSVRLQQQQQPPPTGSRDQVLQFAVFCTGTGVGSVLHWFCTGVGSVLHWFCAGVGSVLHWLCTGVGCKLCRWWSSRVPRCLLFTN